MRYFVSFYYDTKDGWSHGNTESSTQRNIRTIEDIRAVELGIRKALLDEKRVVATSLVITNYIKLG